MAVRRPSLPCRTIRVKVARGIQDEEACRTLYIQMQHLPPHAQQEALLLQMDHAMRCVSRNLVNAAQL